MTEHSTQSIVDQPQPPNQRCKVMFVETAAAMGGVQRATLDLLEALDRAYWEPLLVSPEEGSLTQACRRAGVKVYILPRPRMLSTSFWISGNRRLPNPFAWAWDLGAIAEAMRRVARLLGHEQPDLVVTKGLACHFYGGLAAQRLGIPCVWHVQDFISERFGGIYRRVFGQMARHVPSNIIVIGPPIARQLPADVHGRVRVIYNGVDTKVFRPDIDGAAVRRELGIGRDKVIIGNLARLTPWKGQHHLLEAFARVARDPRTQLLLVGGPLFDSQAYEHRLRSRARELGLSDRVIFTGHRDDVPQVLAAMDIFAYSSVEKDICPLSLLQAMATGLPIVAFDIEGMRRAITSGEHGLLVPVGEPEPLAEAIAGLVSNEGLRDRLARRARCRAEEEFTLERHCVLMEAAFRWALSQPRARSSKRSVHTGAGAKK